MNTTEQNIIENNKLIAEFIGRKGKVNKYLYTFKEIPEPRNIWFTPQTAKFHSSWDWLMPVVEKIESLEIQPFLSKINISDVSEIEGNFWFNRFLNTVETYANVNYWHPEYQIDELNDITGISPIDAMYKAVVQFITWYNENKKS